MSRFEFGGWVGLGGGPLPGEALPDKFSANTAALVLLLETGDFHPEEYISFGYTHFEAWCIGASGGYGGNETSTIVFDQVITRPRMSAGDWAKYLELQHIYETELTPPPIYTKWDPTPRPGAPNGQEVIITFDEWIQIQFPNHDPFNVYTYSNPHLGAAISAYGGGGGGGGLQIVGGLLEDLPQPTPVVVGQVGANGAAGQSNAQPGEAFTPIPQGMTEKWPTTETRKKELSNYFNEYQYKYPLPHPSFTVGPQPGEAGGTSSFGDVCKASGGEGGDEAIYWPGGVKTPFGFGGDGGLGDRDAAGGGGAGDTVPVNAHGGEDGVLDPALLIGGGGGGGRGTGPGHYEYTSGGGLWGGPSWKLVGNRYGTKGGKGSYSYADTSVYGQGEVRSGDLGGGGGGAHRSGLRFGSYASPHLPIGAVILRIFKV